MARTVDCRGGPRPCPLVGCSMHLLLEVGYNGSITLHPDVVAAVGADVDRWTADDVELALHALPASCALDVADEGPSDIYRVAECLGVTRQATEQSERAALRKCRANPIARSAHYGHLPLLESDRSGDKDMPQLLPGQAQGQLWGAEYGL